MNCFKLVLTCLMVSISVSLMSQNNNEQQNKKENTRVKVEVVNGQNALVLKTGRKSQPSNWGSSYPADIVLRMDDNTRRILDSLVTAPWGSAVKMKDIYNYNVEIAKANMNSNVGLMFTSGTKCVAISEEERNKIKQ